MKNAASGSAGALTLAAHWALPHKGAGHLAVSPVQARQAEDGPAQVAVKELGKELAKEQEHRPVLVDLLLVDPELVDLALAGPAAVAGLAVGGVDRWA
jgi:hypothetical protein